MRRLLLPVVALGLSLGALSSSVRADDPAPDPLAKARQLEQEGQALLDAGRCAEGAQHIAQAWQIRAKVWGGGAAPAAGGPPPPGRPPMGAGDPLFSLEAHERFESLRRALHEEEQAIEEAKKAGAERAQAEHMERAEALRKSMRAMKEALAARGGGDGDRAERKRPEPAANVESKLEALRAALQREDAAIQEAKTAGDQAGFAAHREKAVAIRREMVAVRLALAASTADGDEPGEARRELKALRAALRQEELAIEEAKKAGAERAQAEHEERATALRRRIEALAKAIGGDGRRDERREERREERRGDDDGPGRKAKGGEGKGREPGGRGAAAVEGLVGDVARLRAEVAELRRLMEEMKERLGAK